MKTWIFYYINIKGLFVKVITKDCINPNRTKVWKELNEILDNEYIDRIGYKTI